MKIIHPLCIFSLSILINTAVVSADDEHPWNQGALSISIGSIRNIASLDAKDTYQAKELGADMAFGATYSMILDNLNEIDFAVSKISTSGTQYNYPGSGNEANTLDVSVSILSLYITHKWRTYTEKSPFVFWYGCGLNLGLLKESETENIGTSGGIIKENAITRSSTAAGVHGSAGIDLYPYKHSSLALTTQVRYSIETAMGSFKGETGGIAIFAGIRWDFWQNED